MHASLRERTRHEGGFTLIELLVVMIIIAILMAVAIPTFLAQKNNAVKTSATANIKQIVNAMESCSANIPTGGYVNADASFNCTLPATLDDFEKGLANLNITDAAEPAIGEYGVVAIGTQGYLVQTKIQDGDKEVFFAEIHEETGTIVKGCGEGVMASGSEGAKVEGSRTCATGNWG